MWRLGRDPTGEVWETLWDTPQSWGLVTNCHSLSVGGCTPYSLPGTSALQEGPRMIVLVARGILRQCPHVLVCANGMEGGGGWAPAASAMPGPCQSATAQEGQCEHFGCPVPYCGLVLNSVLHPGAGAGRTPALARQLQCSSKSPSCPGAGGPGGVSCSSCRSLETGRQPISLPRTVDSSGFHH